MTNAPHPQPARTQTPLAWEGGQSWFSTDVEATEIHQPHGCVSTSWGPGTAGRGSEPIDFERAMPFILRISHSVGRIL